MRLPHIAIFCTIALVTSVSTSSELANTPATEMANPASVHCINPGGKLTMKRTPQCEFGMCTLPSGRVCEEWALFRGACV